MRTYSFVGATVLLCIFLVILILGKTATTIPVTCTNEEHICSDGTAVGRTGPNCEFSECPIVTEPVADAMIVIDTPKPQETVSSPITISGKARGNWFFEASFPITVVNWDGLIIGQGIATAQGEWMTSEFVPFTARISYTLPPETPYNRGALILKKDNPSGLPEHDDSREIPIIFDTILP